MDHGEDNSSLLTHLLNQGIIDPAGTKTFAKEPKFAKLLRKVKSSPVRCHKKVHGFFSNVCNHKFVVFVGSIIPWFNELQTRLVVKLNQFFSDKFLHCKFHCPRQDALPATH